MKHFNSLLAFATILIALSSCRQPEILPVHNETNGVYYWKTSLQLDSASLDFMAKHDVGRIYLRLFDVVVDHEYDPEPIVPNASLTVDSDVYTTLYYSLQNIDFVPVVYITLDALKEAEGQERDLADKIVTRVSDMCSYNDISNVKELQLDCDWTASTEDIFFALCDSIKSAIEADERPWLLSSTIRLHQLARKAPPVDYGVLMVYNTGNFDDPDATNSIIDINDIKPYLKNLSDYPLHLDIAYPTYSWQLLFSHRQFMGLLNGVDVADTARFAPYKPNVYRAKTNIPHNDHLIREGYLIRVESSHPQKIIEVKKLIEDKLKNRPHANILYHLDPANLSKYTDNEINDIFSTTR